MKRVLINMQSTLFAGAITETLRKSNMNIDVFVAENSGEIINTAKWYQPDIVIMEVSPMAKCTPGERVSTGNQIKALDDACKVVLMVDENAYSDEANQVRQLKKDQIIDQFIYGSVSTSYMVALVDTM